MKNRLKNGIILSLVFEMLFVCDSGVFAKSPERYDDIDEIVDMNVQLSVSNKLGIIFPKTVCKTVTDNFVVWGTSDPDQELYMNDQEIVDRAPNGMFEVTVNIPSDGAFSLIFRQGDETKIVPVFKNVEPDWSYNGFAVPGVVLKKESAMDSSIFPTYNVMLNKKTVELQCSAPAGSKVTATFCGSTFNLKQESASTQLGVAAKYSTVVDLSSVIEDGKVYDLGKVLYRVDFQNQQSEKVSCGKVYYSEKLPPFVRVCWEYGKLFKTPSTNSEVVSVLKKGSTDRLVKQEGNFYQLGCGAWVDKKQIEPIFENFDLTNNISGFRLDKDEKSESLVLEGDFDPVFTSGLVGNKLIVRLYNTFGNLDMELLSESSELFDSVTATQNEGFLEFVFELKDESELWGYNVEFDQGNTIIYLKKKPKLSNDDARPLNGITILIDPGHGGSDSGALGLLGEIGSSAEKDINLANSLSLRNRLVSLGANVVMTRENDQYISLSDRAGVIEKTKPDFVVVVHADASLNQKAEGVTVHFTRFNKLSEDFSRYACSLISQYTERLSRGIKNTDFYVSGATFCPTAFCEVGFLTNLKDSASLFSREKIFDLANAIGDAISGYLASGR